MYAGFSDINSPSQGLNQPGFHFQAGYNPRTWTALGFDYSIGSGTRVITPNDLPVALEQQLEAQLAALVQAGIIPANYQLRVPADTTTQTITAGPQYVYRHFQRAALFVRPSLGALREAATPRPTDPIQKQIVAQLTPTGHKVDWTGFYGFGGGGDFNITKHFGIRAQFDMVYNHPFNDILRDGRWTERYSIGPSFHFGRNVAAAKPMK